MGGRSAWCVALVALLGGCKQGLVSVNGVGSGGTGGTGVINQEEGPNMCIPTSSPDCTDTCLKAGTILKNHCAGCHNEPAHLGVTPFGFVLDPNQMIDASWQQPSGEAMRFLVPGDPNQSTIYYRSVITQDMPPITRGVDTPVFPRVDYSEGSLLYYWISSCLGVQPSTGGGAGGGGGTGGQGPPDTTADAGSPDAPAADGGGTPACTDASLPDDAFGATCGTTYPPTGFYGQNILAGGCTTLDSRVQTYEMAVDIADPLSLSVTWTLLSGEVWYIGDSDWRFTLWQGPETGPGEQRFAPRFAGRNEARMMFMGPGQARIDIYECGSTVPTRTQVVTWQ